MGKEDIKAKQYLSNPVFFADAFNYHLYGGRQIIHPEDLREMDTTELAVPYGNDADSAVQKFRDVLKQWTVMAAPNAVYALLGIESQLKTHYAMPVRNMLYDALNYDKQVYLAASTYHDKNKKKKFKLTREEYLSGFRKDDRLIPVITLVIFFNPSEWDGARSIHKMLAVQDKEVLKYVQDYRLNLISPAEIPPGKFSRFHTGLGKVLEFIKNSNDKEKMKQMLRKNETFLIDTVSVDLLNTITKSKIKYAEEDTEVDMCKALDDWGKELKNEGRKAGEKIGREAGERIGREAGEKIGRENSDIDHIRNLMETLQFSVSQAMDVLKVPTDKRAQYASKI